MAPGYTTEHRELGLTSANARERLAKHGLNQIVIIETESMVGRFFRAFKNPLVLVLFVAALLSSIFGELKSAILITVIILLSSVLNFYQEYRSGKAAEKLSAKLALTTTVLRDGEPKEISATHVVPGDAVLLSAGEVIPADGTVAVADDFFVNEAALTGESFPVEKEPGDAGDKKVHQVFAGTTVVSGSATVIVTATGRATAFGGIAKSISAAPTPTAFENGVTSFGMLIIKATVFIVVTVFCITVFKPLFFHNAITRPMLVDSFLFALAIAVGLTPELLPMIMSINMAKGSVRMSRKGVIVKRLNAIPDFGSIDVLCTDKTGTLTEDTITLVKYVDAVGAENTEVLGLAALNSFYQTGLKSPLDAAVRAAVGTVPTGYAKVDEIPYDFERKRLSIVVEKDTEHILVTKGQPDEIFKICSSVRRSGKAHAFTTEAREQVSKVYNEMSGEGFQTLAICSRTLPTRATRYGVASETEMVLEGLIGFYDPPKKTASRALKVLERYGIEVKIITGDNEHVTGRICKELDIPVKGVLTGDEMAHISQAALPARVEGVTIFARFNPDQKRRVIRALRERGHVVGYLGDGINDAPSLTAADIGISVHNAVDVAKESAAIVLSHKSLRELGDGIVEGRITFGNTMKYLMMGLSSNFGNMFSLIAAAIFLPFLPILPFQVLLNNSLYDIAQTTIPTDSVDAEYIERPKRWDLRFMRRFMVVFGLLSSVFDIITFYFLFSHFHLPAAAFQTGWFMESLATQTLVVYAIRTRRPLWRSRPSGYLIGTTLTIVLAGIALPYMPFGSWFNLVPLPLTVLGTIVVIILAYLVIVEIAKYFFYRYLLPQGTTL